MRTIRQPGTWPVKDREELELESELERIRRNKRKRALRDAIQREGGWECEHSAAFSAPFPPHRLTFESPRYC